MPCYFNGQITGDDRVSCSATPGKIWQSEPSLMSDPTTGQGLPMVGTTEAPMQNLTAYMIPGAGPAKQAATKALPYVKKGVQSLFTKPGVVQKTIPKMKQMADGTVKQIGTKTVDKAGRVMSVPRASATAIGAAGLYDNAVSPNPYGGAGPVMDRKVVQPPSDTAPTTPTTNKKNDGLLVDGLTGDDLKGVAESGDIPTSMWDKMQTKGYWLDGVEGGSGKWDNRLFRLGEMMTHMGTPLSKQGKSPAERWTTATATANKAATAAAAAKAKLDKPVDLFSKIGNKTMVDAIQEKVAKKMGKDQWSSFDPDEADVLQASNEAIIAIQTMMSRNNPLTGQTYTYNEAEQMVLGSIK
jgi:hypothetical protein